MGVGHATIMYDGVALEDGFADVSACRYDGIEVGLEKIETAGPDAVANWLDEYDLDLYCVMGHWIESEEAAESLADSAELAGDLGAEFLGILPPQRHRNEDKTVESWLRTVSEAALDAGATPILHHHGGPTSSRARRSVPSSTRSTASSCCSTQRTGTHTVITFPRETSPMGSNASPTTSPTST